MFEDWEAGQTLDRIDNDSGYCQENCQWLSKGKNVKTLLVEPAELLAMYEKGYSQQQLADMYGTDQPHVSRILKRARNGKTS
jgi:hypothetical protein